MRDLDILWFVEHTARELDVACATRYLIEERYDDSVEIKPYYRGDPTAILRSYRPTVVVIPYCYSAGDYGLREYLPQWREPIYFNLAWEELYYSANLEYKAPRDVFAKDHVLHHAWGDFYRQYLLKYGVPDDHIEVNGQPAYTLYDEPYRRFFATRAEIADASGLDRDRRWVFFPENYGWAFFSDQRLEAAIKAGQHRETAYAMRDFCKASLETALRWLADVAADGSVEVIVRPRPATQQSDFEEFARQIVGTVPVRLHITKERSVREWILASDIVASSYSTSLIEAAVANRPAYMVLPLPIPDSLVAGWYEHATVLAERGQFMEACLAEPDLDSSERLRRWGRKELMGCGDAISNLADTLHRLCQPGAVRPPVPSEAVLRPPKVVQDPLSLRLYYRLRHLAGKAKRALGPGELVADMNYDEFTDEDVKRGVAAFGRILGAEASVVQRCPR